MSDSLIARARKILKNEGLAALFGRILLLLKQNLYLSKKFYLYEHILKERNEADYMPKMQGFTYKVISSNSQAYGITREGFEDIRKCPVLVNVRTCLNKGAIAFCFFIGKELAHIGWIAMDEGAKNTFDNYPYHVDFSNGQACTGGTVTLPKYRGNGFMVYGYFKRLEYLWIKGYKTSRNAVNRDNKVSQKVHAKFNPRILARARYLKIAGLTFWKETI